MSDCQFSKYIQSKSDLGLLCSSFCRYILDAFFQAGVYMYILYRDYYHIIFMGINVTFIVVVKINIHK